MEREIESKLLDYLDRGSWKNSWHLKKDQYGYVDWHNPENLEKIRRILNGFKTEGEKMIQSSNYYLQNLPTVGQGD